MLSSSLILLTSIVFHVRIVETGYCMQTFSCSNQEYTQEQYYVRCWFLRRCTRYRKVSVIRYTTCSRRICCHGYTGQSCKQAVCYGSTSCPNGGTCSSPDTCSCRPGFGGSRCEDINECLVSNGGCSQICRNSIGSFLCKCENGYYLGSNRKTCLDINECEVSNGGCSQICRNSIGSFQCHCKNGYFLGSDRKTCLDINECEVSNGGCSQICRNSIGSFQCNCKNGYFLGSDRKSCLDLNECLDITCLNNGSCLNYEGSYACQCNQGFSGDVCQSDINECLLSNDTCDDQCINTNGSFYCKCTGGSSSLSEDGVSCKVNVKEKSYNSVAVGLGTGLSLALAIVAVVFLAVLKNRHKRPSSLEETNQTSNGYQSQIWNSGVRTIYTGLSGNYENAPKPVETENNRSMNEYESVVVTQAVKVNDETERQISPYDNIQIKGITDDSGQHRPDRDTAEYENLVIFRKIDSSEL
ncbi:EGF-like and EMI domain-containing protein 1 [Mytilus edulis]|uniref:EGF-like and EMI domain-containing protein 1 n=1 Tax=Mytilus edulis TaxID=6550 RepID=UPI0039EFAA21